MAEVDPQKFDPYYKWLGIPPQEQPPNSYRLLGITLFEDDPEVIAAAADRQMAHVKSFAAGKYAAHSQQLLNELSKARVSLLNAERKARYDASLKKEAEERAVDASIDDFFSAELEAAPPIRISAPTPTFFEETEPPPVRKPSYRRKKESSPWVALILLLCSICVGFVAVQLVRESQRSNSATAKQQTAAPPPSRDRPAQTGQPPQQEAGPAPGSQQISPAPLPVVVQRRQIPPLSEPAARRQHNSQIPVHSAAEEADIVIDVDLSERHQRVKVGHDSFKIVRLRIPGSDNDLSTPLSLLQSARIDVDIDLQAKLNLKVERTPNATFIVIEPVVTVGDEEFSLTPASLGRQRRQVARTYQRSGVALATLNRELQQLDTFIRAPVMKPLAERGLARKRKMQIEKELPALQQQVAQLENSLQGLNRLVELAKSVDAEGVIELAIAD
jgi:hypothetical protein